MISTEILEKFEKLYKEKYDITLTDEETTQLATDLINLMRVLLKPEPKPISNAIHQEERRQDETIGTLQY